MRIIIAICVLFLFGCSDPRASREPEQMNEYEGTCRWERLGLTPVPEPGPCTLNVVRDETGVVIHWDAMGVEPHNFELTFDRMEGMVPLYKVDDVDFTVPCEEEYHANGCPVVFATVLFLDSSPPQFAIYNVDWFTMQMDL